MTHTYDSWFMNHTSEFNAGNGNLHGIYRFIILLVEGKPMAMSGFDHRGVF